MAKLSETENMGHHREFTFYCPGCECGHSYSVAFDNQQRHSPPMWTFNGDMEKPTFRPSLLYPDETRRCHLHITDGKIEYCNDCFHHLSGQTIDMVDEGGD